MTSLSANLKLLRERIEKRSREWGRDPEAVKLLAVSKTQNLEKITEALEAGVRFFGENRVQEAYSHWEDLRRTYPDLRLHLIGPLQTNKVKEAVALFDAIETVDRPSLARELQKEITKQKRNLTCFVQVNTGAEPQKSGVAISDFPALLNLCQEIGLSISGLMCIPPPQEPAGLHFALLKKLAKQNGLNELSMGMSGDFETAIQAGATIVRIGTALFGERE
ncbi:MAG: YggS family pyridoxal phosphate-dependent enzyme [Alphaproteobacteria bacterium]|nr:YggS family pyridoxal phosphate-dependent enzyme [Alphaproteobacteria bacterium]MBP9868278.1 YggS family pyridoxal phosphate-dependent enzyme [Alphaproteobacteria bacterium]